MSLSPSHDEIAVAMTDSGQTQSRSGLLELVVAVVFAATVSVAMIGWLYLLAVALWNGACWLLS
jgi:hypothetical protein